ncbi:MAG TPA: cupin domain-containing protein [Patescibacteria group bacterium]|nr:cupin domain-containing protein [Patescibacteria group bacterium]
MSIQRIPALTINKKGGNILQLKIDSPFLLPQFQISEKMVIVLPPQAIGGNHMHPRTEICIALSPELQLFWQENGVLHQEMLFHPGELVAYIIPSHLPHAVVNISRKNVASMIEYANNTQHDVEHIEIVRPL